MIPNAVNAMPVIMATNVPLAIRLRIVLERSLARARAMKNAVFANQAITEINARHVDRFQIASEA